ncbi:c-type heme family protein [Desulfuromonas thiophila]|uniref:histidine kinase n=1 Tax=Desulfuromonas thiophila TaxID=57664 RepID=A0A1G7CD68_9BACT|nr:DUF3365 domain-containing protein [Desulfuromonas thiophila]SDE37249.1 HAMP domain-containing protein [Desulfuromonas thiophila]
MGLKSKLSLLVLTCYALFLLASGWVEYCKLEGIARHQILQQARDVKNLMMATRYVYHHQFLASGVDLTPATLGFLPAHALARISERFNQAQKSGLLFNNVSAMPRNPANQADPAEQQLIDYFRHHPQQTEYFERVDGANSYFQYAAPIWVEDYCLECHGEAALAPPTIRSRYSSGFGYRVGDLRGIISVRVPSRLTAQFVRAYLHQTLPLALLSGLLLFAFLALVLNRLVLRRLGSLLGVTRALREGDYQQRSRMTEQQGCDEIDRLGADIDRMASAIGEREAALRAVAQRLARGQRMARLAYWDYSATAGLRVSPQMLALFGLQCWPDDDLAALPGSQRRVSLRRLLRVVRPAERQRLYHHLRQARFSGTFTAIELPLELAGAAPRQVRIDAEVGGGETADLALAALHLSGTAQDVSEVFRAQQRIRELHAALEEQVNQRICALQQGNQQQQDFCLALAETLHRPLGVLSRQPAASPMEAAAALARLERLVADLHDYLELGHCSLHKQSCDLTALVEERLAASGLRQRAGLQLRLASLPPAQADPAALRRLWDVLFTLVTWRTATQPAVEIQIGSRSLEGETHYYLRDNGPAWPASGCEEASFFKPFACPALADHPAASGLELAIAWRIVQRHGGRLWYSNEDPQGASFAFTLPLGANQPDVVAVS